MKNKVERGVQITYKEWRRQGGFMNPLLYRRIVSLDPHEYTYWKYSTNYGTGYNYYG